MRTMRLYTVPFDGEVHQITLSQYMKPVAVAYMEASSPTEPASLVFWCEHESTWPERAGRFKVFETDEKLPSVGQWVGTVLMPRTVAGALHLYEVGVR